MIRKSEIVKCCWSYWSEYVDIISVKGGGEEGEKDQDMSIEYLSVIPVKRSPKDSAGI
jgi:hypothetical protein